jgi:hypothetical protein
VGCHPSNLKGEPAHVCFAKGSARVCTVLLILSMLLDDEINIKQDGGGQSFVA